MQHSPIWIVLLLASFLISAGCMGIPENPAIMVLTSEPGGATVFIDSLYSGTTPLVRALPPGPHEVSVTYPGYTPYNASLVVNPGFPMVLPVVLGVQPGGDKGDDPASCPVAGLVSPAVHLDRQAAVTPDGVVTVTGTATGGSAECIASLSALDGDPGYKGFFIVPVDDGKFSGTFNTSSLPQGRYILTVESPEGAFDSQMIEIPGEAPGKQDNPPPTGTSTGSVLPSGYRPAPEDGSDGSPDILEGAGITTITVEVQGDDGCRSRYYIKAVFNNDTGRSLADTRDVILAGPVSHEGTFFDLDATPVPLGTVPPGGSGNIEGTVSVPSGDEPVFTIVVYGADLPPLRAVTTISAAE